MIKYCNVKIQYTVVSVMDSNNDTLKSQLTLFHDSNNVMLNSQITLKCIDFNVISKVARIWYILNQLRWMIRWDYNEDQIWSGWQLEIQASLPSELEFLLQTRWFAIISSLLIDFNWSITLHKTTHRSTQRIWNLLPNKM